MQRDPPTASRLAATLCARICHDLAGSLGALTGMLEMAIEDSDPEALATALACARDATARLKLLRAAWSHDTEIPQIETLLSGLPGADRLTIRHALPAGLPDTQTRLALTLAIVAASALPRGGTLHIESDGPALRAQIAGPRIAWPGAVSACLANPAALDEACNSPRDVAIALLCLQATDLGLTPRLTSDDTLDVR